jgi:hypothetical protein
MNVRRNMVVAGIIRPAINGVPVKAVEGRPSKVALWNAGFTIAATRRVPEIDAKLPWLH